MTETADKTQSGVEERLTKVEDHLVKLVKLLEKQFGGEFAAHAEAIMENLG